MRAGWLAESMEKKKVSNHIPHDIAFDILSKLPVKSLKRFSCVRKSWANLFDSPQFVTMYRNNFLSKDDNHNTRLLLKQSSHQSYDDRLLLLSGENSIELDWPPPFHEYPYTEDIFIVGSVVNGILCLYQGDGDVKDGTGHWIWRKVVLWNPSTEEFKIIPSGSTDCPFGTQTQVRLHGFGYDPMTNDYKLIRFCFLHDTWMEHPKEEPLWQIYSLRSNRWRELHVKMASHCWAMRALFSPNIGFAIYLNGVCHWLGSEDYHGEEVLVSFNLSHETFIKTPLNCHGDVYLSHLAVLKGSIALISRYDDTNCFEISILGEPGVMESWIKLCTVGPLPCIHETIGVGKKGDVFFAKIPISELARFDLNTEMIEEIGFKGKYLCCQVVTYNESLLPIEEIN